MGTSLTLFVCDDTKRPWKVEKSYALPRNYPDFARFGMYSVEEAGVPLHVIPDKDLPTSPWPYFGETNHGYLYVAVQDLKALTEGIETWETKTTLHTILEQHRPDQPVIVAWS